MQKHEIIFPDGWKKPIGYSDGILATEGKILFIAGQVGWDENQIFQSSELVPQFEQALKNIMDVLKKANGKPEHICRMTCFCIDKKQYLDSRRELGSIWKKILGNHYPCMSMIFVSDLLDHPALIEIETTAVIPEKR